MDAIEPYLASIRSKKRLLHAQMDLQKASNILVPGDLTRLYLALDTPEFDWLAKDLRRIAPYWTYMTSPAMHRAAHRSQLVVLPMEGQVQIYETPGIEKQAKRLYILYSGRKGQLFIPLAIVLHQIPTGPKDILVVRANMGEFKGPGFEGLGETLAEMAATLKSHYKTDEYRHVTVTGFSLGCNIALQTAEILKADLCVLLAIRYLLPFKKLDVQSSQGVSPFDHVCDCTKRRAKRVVNVFASKHELDVQSSRMLKNIRPEMIEYHLVIPKVHNILEWLIRTRTIRLFFMVVYGERGVVLRLIAPVFAMIGNSFRAIRQKLGWQRRFVGYPHKSAPPKM